VPPLLADLYGYAWFIGFGIAFVVYLALRKLTPAPELATRAAAIS
jgi:cytosine/uracil/thiamine/allantoin permease